MRRRTVKKVMILCLLLFFIIPVVAYAQPGGGNNISVHDAQNTKQKHDEQKDKEKKGKSGSKSVTPKKKKQGGVVLESQKYPSGHYFPIAHVDDSWWPFSSKKVAKGINSLSTGLFALNKQLSQVVDASLNKFISLNVIKKVKDYVTDAADDIWDTMKDHFAAILIAVAMVQILVYYIAERNGNKAGKTSLRLLAIVGIAFLWLSNSGYYLSVLNHLTAEGEGYMMDASTTLTADKDQIKKGHEVAGATAILRNKYFNMSVRRPYLIMNYGTTNEKKIQKKADKGENRIKHMLAYKTDEQGSKARDDLAEKEVKDKQNQYMGEGGVWSKFGISLLSIPFTLFLGIPLFILAFFNVVLQFLVLFFAFILPITFIVSILPSFANSGWHTLARLLSTFMMKIFIGILILFTFMVFDITDTLIPPDTVGSYYLNMCLAALLLLMLIMKRDKIIELITAGRVVAMTGQTGAGMYSGARRATNMARSGGSHTASKGLTAAVAGVSAVSAMRSGAAKGIDSMRNRSQSRNQNPSEDSQYDQPQADPKGSGGHVVDLQQYRQNRTPQGSENGQGGADGQKGKDGQGRQDGSDGDVSDANIEANTNHVAHLDRRNETRTPQGDKGKDNDTNNTDDPHMAPQQKQDRSRSRTHPRDYEKQQNPTSGGHTSARAHRTPQTDLDQNPQTNGEMTPPKKPTQWEAGKQTENMKNKGKRNRGRNTGASSNGGDSDQRHYDRLKKENLKNQRNRQSQEHKSQRQQSRNQSRNQRLDEKVDRIKQKDTKTDKFNHWMKGKRQDIVKRRKRRR